MTIVNAIPAQTVILGPAAAALCQRILNLLSASTGPAVRAYWLHNLGIRLYGLGRPAEALPVVEEAVAMCRELATASPDRYRPDLADSLGVLGALFSVLGRPAEAAAGDQGSRSDPPGAGRRQPGPLPPRPRQPR